MIVHPLLILWRSVIGREKTNLTSVESPQLVGALSGRNVDKNAMSSDAALAARDFFGGTLGGMTGDSTERDFPNKKKIQAVL